MRTLDLLAAVGSSPAGPDTSLLFYQAAAGVFAVLLLTGVAGEIREIRTRLTSEDGPMSGPLQAQLAGITVLLFFAMGGELLSLSVLLDPPAHKFEQLAVSFFLATTVIGIPLLMLGSLGEYRPKEFRRLTQLLLVVLFSLLLGSALYLIATAIDRSPSTYTYHVYGTCAAGSCGLNERKRPSVEAEPLGQLRDGDEVEIVCQAKGGMAVAPNGLRSDVWDKLGNGSYVSDVAVDTPRVGNPIPACEQPDPDKPHTG